MTEEDAKAWIAAQFGNEAVERLTRLETLVLAESESQNLIAPSTLNSMWSRHIADSAQLIEYAPPAGRWLDIGTGAGFPGLVIAILRTEETVLVEPRRKRAAFLEHAAERLKLPHVTVRCQQIEQLALPSMIISARAVASVENLLRGALPCATMRTRWLLPRGLFDENDLAAVQASWNGTFHMKQSVTDPRSTILIVDGVEPR